MRSALAGIAAAVLCANVAAAAPTAAPWQTYRYPDLGLAVDMPAAPARSSSTVPISADPSISITSLTVPLGTTGALFVGVTDYAGLGLTKAMSADPAVQAKVLEGGVQGSLAKSGSELISETNITVNGAPGRDYTFKSKTGEVVGRAWMVLYGARGYTVVGAGAAAGGVPTEFDRVAHSLALSEVK